jgi:hypothetical protein
MRTPTTNRGGGEAWVRTATICFLGKTCLTRTSNYCRLFLKEIYCSRPAFLQPPSHREAGLLYFIVWLRQHGRRWEIAYGTRRAGPPSDSARCSIIHIRAKVLGPIPMDFARYRSWRNTLGVSRTEIPSESSSSRIASSGTLLLCRVCCVMKCDTSLRPSACWPERVQLG